MPDWSLPVLVLSLLLFTAATLDSEEQQKESYDSSKVSADPGPPLNIVATPVGNMALNVSWDPPEEPPDHYTVEVFLTGFNEVADGTFFLIEKLDNCTTYLITVSSVYSSGPPYSDYISGTTNTPVLPPPETCQFTPITSSMMTVSWHDPDIQCDKDKIVNHSISLSLDVLWSDEEWSYETFSTEPSITLSNLSPYTNITASIAVINTGGVGLPTTCGTVTPEAVPGPPSSMHLQQDITSITVTWDPPKEENGNIIGYKVTWDDGKGHSDEETMDNLVLSYTIQNLTLCLEYTVSVSANTSIGWGDAVQDKATIPNYLPVDALECNGNESREVNLAWSLASPDCYMSEYSLTWNTTVKWSNQQDGNITTLPGISTSYLIDNLQPYTEIYACLIVDEEEGGASCCTTTTQEEVPGPPVNLSLEADQTSLLVSWENPEAKNGEIIAFLLTWEDEDGNSYNDTMDNTVFSYTIGSITLCLEYIVTVAANTSAGWGAGAQAQAHIPNYLTAMNCGNGGHREVRLTWHLATPDCPMSGYILAWNSTVMWGSNQPVSNTTTIAGTSTNTVITQLEPYTMVHACLSVDGDVRDPVCCSATTLEELASEPTNLTAFNQTTTQVDLSWLPPNHLNGKQENWHIAVFSDSSTVLKQDLDKGILKHSVTELNPGTDYHVTLQALNGAGLGANATVEFRTVSDNSSSNIGVIIGASVGGVVLLVLLVGGIAFYFTRRNNKSDESNGSVSMLEILEDQQYTRRESQAFGGVIDTRRASRVNGETGVNGDLYQGDRRPSQAQYTRRNSQAAPEAWRRPSQVLGARKVSQAYLGQRRPSLVQSTSGTFDVNFGQRRPSLAHSTPGSIDGNHGQRRPSQAPTASGSDYTNFGQTRPSEVQDARKNSEAYPGPRRPSRVPGAYTNDAAYPGIRRASEVTIGKGIEKNNFPGKRRASEAPGVLNSGGNNYHGQRRASEAPGVLNSRGNNYHGQRRASEAPGVLNSGGNNYHGQRRASEMPGRSYYETQNNPK